MEQCEVTASRINVRSRQSDWIFEARGIDGTALYSTTPFKSQAGFVFLGTDEFKILSSFVTRLEREGWTVIRTPPRDKNGDWYKVRFAKGTPQDIQSLMAIEQMKHAAPDIRRPWLTTQKMWTFTILIGLALFACCIVLVFTSELKIGPT